MMDLNSEESFQVMSFQSVNTPAKSHATPACSVGLKPQEDDQIEVC